MSGRLHEGDVQDGHEFFLIEQHVPVGDDAVPGMFCERRSSQASTPRVRSSRKSRTPRAGLVDLGEDKPNRWFRYFGDTPGQSFRFRVTVLPDDDLETAAAFVRK